MTDNNHEDISDTDHAKEKVFVPLMPFENAYGLQFEPGITTINFFGADDVDYDISVQQLKDRLKRIAQANPWLVGRIVRNNKKIRKKMTTTRASKSKSKINIKRRGLLLSFPKIITDSDIDAIFVTSSTDQILERSTISSSSAYEDVTNILKQSGAIVKTGAQLINQDDRVTKVTFVPVFNEQRNKGLKVKEYSLVVSLGHLAGDGFTYYKLMGMICDESKIESLKVDRISDFDNVVKESIGPKEKSLFSSPWLLINFFAQMLLSKSSNMRVAANYVDESKIAIAKAKAKAKERNDREEKDSTFYCSTNDVISSNYAKAADADCLLMALNLRRRREIVNESYAGNYETVMYYDKESCQFPGDIRKSLRSGPPYRRCSGKAMPTWFQKLTMEISFITSWAFPSFDPGHLRLWTSKSTPTSSSAILHLPVYEISPIGFAIVFKPCAGKLAVMYYYKSNEKKNKKATNTASNTSLDLYERVLASGEVLGETVNKEMFSLSSAIN